MIRTWQARLRMDPEANPLLGAYAELFDKLERKLFAALVAGKSINELKREFVNKLGITARQFNAINIELRGKIRSIVERRRQLITEAKERIAKAQEVLLKKKGDSNAVHQKKRRLAKLEQKLAQLEADEQQSTIRLCFGSKKLFHAQFNLEKNGYANRAEWLADWRNARSASFMVIGSQDETAGNQSCQAQYLGNDDFSLRLRLPKVIGGFLDLKLSLPHGGKQLVEALAASRIIRTTTFDGKQIKKRIGRAITYRFLRDAKGWRVFVSIDLPEPKRVSHEQAGAIGVDINSDHLAVTEINHHGNILKTAAIPLPIQGKTQHQALAIIGEAVKQIFLVHDKPLVIEKLDFAKKKAALEGESAVHNRRISAFAYSRIIQTIKARAFDAGLEVIEVNPAYTSVIGRYKFAQRYGISHHLAAACAIARRGLHFSERPNHSMKDQVAFALPARNRAKHVWSFWGKVARKKARPDGRPKKADSRKLGRPLPCNQLEVLPVQPRRANRQQYCSADVMAFK